jgi:hypothetical protein
MNTPVNGLFLLYFELLTRILAGLALWARLCARKAGPLSQDGNSMSARAQALPQIKARYQLFMPLGPGLQSLAAACEHVVQKRQHQLARGDFYFGV